MAINGFYWLIEGVLAGCARPGAARASSADARATSPLATLAADLEWLREQGIGAVLSLTETPLPEEALARHDLAVIHIPVDDMTAPAPEQFEEALTFIDNQRLLGKGVAVHCKMGQGRTATILAAYLIRAGATSTDAIKELRALCPGAISAEEQERALHAFARRRDWIV